MSRIKKEKLSQSDLIENDGIILNSYLDYGENFPIDIEVNESDLDKLGLYDFSIKGRVFRSGLEIICVELLRKHI